MHVRSLITLSLFCFFSLHAANKEWQHISGALQKMEQEGLSRVHVTHEYAAYDGSLVGTEFAETKPQQQLQIKEPATPSKESTVLPCFTERPDLPTTFVTPVDDTPKVTTTACPGMRPEDVPSKNDVIICGGMTIPEQKPLHTGHPVELVKPILHLAQAVNDAVNVVKGGLTGLVPFGNQSPELKQFGAQNTLEEAIQILESNTTPNSTKEVVKNDKTITIFTYDNGTISIRTGSKASEANESMPTIEIIIKGSDVVEKIRLLGDNKIGEL
jgi:hypothetical protein